MIAPAMPGLCGNEDPDLFFGDTAASVKRACARCPVQIHAICLTWALEQDLKFGIFGGMTRAERVDYATRSAA